MKKKLSRFLTVVIASFAVLVMTCTPVLAAGNITEAQAKKIALKDAGLKEKAVIFLKIELDEGRTDDTEDVSGEASMSSTDQNSSEDQGISGDQSSSADKSSSEDAKTKDTETQDAEIKDTESTHKEDATEGTDNSAFEENKSDESQTETSDVPKYEIEFYHDGTEYEYEIDAKTGEILKVSKDTEFFLNPGALPTTLP